MRIVRLALAQINPTVGDFDGNKDKIIDYAHRAAELGADVIAFPELVVCGYPPEDLLFHTGFLDEAGRVVDEVARKTAKLNSIIVLGFPERDDDTYNAAALIYRGRVWDTYRKIFLPNYGVFDEKRYFAPGERITVYETQGFRFAVGICEDIWHPEGPLVAQTYLGNCEFALSINASPYHHGKRELRERMVGTRASDNAVAVAYLNCVGGQDELVFDGQSFVVDAEGEIIARAGAFSEELLIVDVNLEDVFRRRLRDPRTRDRRFAQLRIGQHVDVVEIPFIPTLEKPPIEPVLHEPPEPLEEIWLALVCGLRDYVCKNGFKSVILGLSGGIDSALVAAIASDAVGPENVYALFMPTRFTAQQSFVDAQKLAKNLGINLSVVEIEPLFKAYLSHLEPHFRGTQFDITEENIQSRIRGNILMAFSNKFGHLVLATGNKSETSVGYATLYGDMVGGFAVIKDVPKTLVWQLARWRNRKAGRDLIPQSIIDRPPTAELRKDQLDTDTLPPYDVLDQILELYIEQEMPVSEIIDRTGFDEAVVKRVAAMVDKAEYKRRQAPPGIKITARAFDRERRMPITKKGGFYG